MSDENVREFLINKTREAMKLIEETRVANMYSKQIWANAMQNILMRTYISMGTDLKEFEEILMQFKKHYVVLLKEHKEFMNEQS